MTDPKGLLRFMTGFPSVEDDPGVELWKDDAKWKPEKVEEGVMKTAREFSDEHKEDWRLLFGFHRDYTSDQIPTMPGVFHTPSGRDHIVNGAPLPWHKMWSALRRFPRPHLEPSSISGTATEGQLSESSMRVADDASKQGSDEEEGEEEPLAVSNVVTGIGRSKTERRKGIQLMRAHQQVCAVMCNSRSCA